ncbi:MAG: NADH-quinone oxidoreductase subunit C [Planctomycetes bacterium]|nr:NADH-quinone oxidoreductase subunit C [Planctomycetota bacterium]
MSPIYARMSEVVLNIDVVLNIVKDELGLDLVQDESAIEGSSLVVPSESLLSVMEVLRQHEKLKFRVLMSQTGVHRGEDMLLFYHLHSYEFSHTICVLCVVPAEGGEVDSVSCIWSGADWLERETFDLLGVHFKGHPNLRRIMMPEDWEGHPLRKDYKMPTEYAGIDNTPCSLEKLDD